MNTLFQKTIGAGLFLLCFTVSTQAQTNEIIYSTAKDAFLTFTAIVQTADGGTNKVRITNTEIIAALNATGAFNFTNNPKLMMRSDNAAQPYFVVRDSGTNEFDISQYLSVTAEDDAVHNRNSHVNWEIWNVVFSGGGLDFSFWSLTTLYTGEIPTGAGGSLERTTSLNSVGSGIGNVNGENAQFTGKVIAIRGRTDGLDLVEPGQADASGLTQ